jgi:hypothetical protein
VVVGIALAAYPAARSDELGRGLAILGAVACVLLAGGLAFRLASAVAPSLVVLGGGYAVVLATDFQTVDPWSPVYAGGLLLLAELAYGSLERQAAPDEPGMLVRWLATLAALVAGCLVVGTLLLGGASAASGDGLVLLGIGVAAAATALALLTRLIWAQSRAGS